ncbi:MAG TPA: hypothetical protein VLA77_00090 [Candidatus Saccharimonadales bacterium]|nr:hypothetical protein [Candidatus Saccharimonadales bacterium]
MNPQSPESFPGVSSSGFKPEVSQVPMEVKSEKQKPLEVAPAQAEARHAAQAMQPLSPVLPAPQAPQNSAQDLSGNPIVAADEDVIEREWVQKAKKIVSQTKDDPYTQEHEISKLQADYIKKRYGKEVKMVGDS